MSNTTVFNILGVMLLANALDKRQGENWYSQAYEIASDIATDTGIALHKVVGVIAALSPNNKWDRNIQDAEAICTTFANGGDLGIIKVCTYGNNKQKAIDILNMDGDCDGKIVDILKGQKIVSFFNCIIECKDDVVIDGHAYSIALGQRLAMKKVPSLTKKLYESLQRDYVEAAELYNKATNCHYTPPQVQAITWCCWHRLHNVK